MPDAVTEVAARSEAPAATRREHRSIAGFDRTNAGLGVLAAALVAIGWWGLSWRGVDLPAQLYRVEQFRAEGFVLWDGNWYAGHWALDYSLLYPPLGAVLGVGVVAVLSAGLAAVAFDRIVVASFGPAARLASVVFAASVVVSTAIGQLAWFTGEAFGLACVALLVGRRRRWVAAGVLALACGATSPLSGALLALALAAGFLTTVFNSEPLAEVKGLAKGQGWRFVVVGALAVAPLAFSTVFFPGQGPMPYPVVDWAWETVVALVVWVVVPPGMRALRVGVVLYLLALGASVAVASPLGGNVGRMEDALALPLVVACCWTRRDAPGRARPFSRWLGARVEGVSLTSAFRVASVGLAVPLFFSQWGPAAAALTSNAGQPWAHEAYYRPLARWLAAAVDRSPGTGAALPEARVEVVPTRDHWEAADVASTVPLARGWERQLDVADNPLFYGRAPLDARTYLAWLKANGVRLVALADAPLDSAGVAEARLLDSGVPGLRLVWHDTHWRVWTVAGGPGIVSGPGRLVASSGGRVDLVASRAGRIEVRVRSAAHWRVAAGSATVAPAPGGWIAVRAERPGRIDLRAGLDI